MLTKQPRLQYQSLTPDLGTIWFWLLYSKPPSPRETRETLRMAGRRCDRIKGFWKYEAGIMTTKHFGSWR